MLIASTLTPFFSKKFPSLASLRDICVADADPPPTLIFSSFFSCEKVFERQSSPETTPTRITQRRFFMASLSVKMPGDPLGWPSKAADIFSLQEFHDNIVKALRLVPLHPVGAVIKNVQLRLRNLLKKQ